MKTGLQISKFLSGILPCIQAPSLFKLCRYIYLCSVGSIENLRGVWEGWTSSFQGWRCRGLSRIGSLLFSEAAAVYKKLGGCSAM